MEACRKRKFTFSLIFVELIPVLKSTYNFSSLRVESNPQPPFDMTPSQQTGCKNNNCLFSFTGLH